MGEAVADALTPHDARRRVGAMALAAETPSTGTRTAIIEGRIPTPSWPAHPLVITAVDTESGEPRFFDRTDGVSLVDAVAASCAVPGIWPAVEIQGRYYMDGGTRTIANADLAAGAARVLILIPSAETGPLGIALPDDELAALVRSQVLTVFADEMSIETMGLNPLDPATRRPTVQAGRAQGRRLAATIAEFWQTQGRA